MKRIFTIIIASMLSAVSTSAQHSVDLEVTMPYPVYHQSITSGLTLLTNVVVKNVGTTTLDSGDIFYYGYFIDSKIQTIKLQGQLRDVFFHTGRELAPGDTMQITRAFKLNFNAAMNGIHEYCLAIMKNESVTDVNLANNAGCKLVILTGGGILNDVEDLENEIPLFELAPNPAVNAVNIKLELNNRYAVRTRLLDLTGRVVTEQDHSIVDAGAQTLQMPLSDIPKGMYICQVQVGNNVLSRKLIVSK